MQERQRLEKTRARVRARKLGRILPSPTLPGITNSQALRGAASGLQALGRPHKPRRGRLGAQRRGADTERPGPPPSSYVPL